MTTLTPTKADGATVRTNAVMYAESACTMTDDKLPPALVESGLNAGFVTDLLSAMLTHERCGRHLYRSVAARTHNPVLRGKYEEFGLETERHAQILEQLISRAGGNPQYVSPMARATEGMATKLVESTFVLSGSLDVMTAEMAMLDAVVVAETIDRANWQTMARLRDELADGDLRAAVSGAIDEVLADEDEHLAWATTTRERLTMLQATSSFAASAAMKAEEMVARVRGWLT